MRPFAQLEIVHVSVQGHQQRNQLGLPAHLPPMPTPLPPLPAADAAPADPTRPSAAEEQLYGNYFDVRPNACLDMDPLFNRSCSWNLSTFLNVFCSLALAPMPSSSHPKPLFSGARQRLSIPCPPAAGISVLDRAAAAAVVTALAGSRQA